MDDATPGPRRGRAHSELHLRRAASVRQHAVRTVQRAAVVVVGDLFALLLLAALASALFAAVPTPDVLRALAGAGIRQGPLVAATLLVSLFAAGAYRQRPSARGAAAVLRGSALAAGLLLWQPVLAADGALLASAVAATAALAVALLVGRASTAWFVRIVWPGRRAAAPAVFVGSRAEFRVVSEAHAADERGDYRLVGWVSPGPHRRADALGGVPRLPTLIHAMDIQTVIVGGSLREDRLRSLREICLAAGCELLYPVRSVRLVGVRPRLVWRHDQPYFELGAPVLRARALLVKRVVDLLGAVAGVVLLTPVMAAIALAVKVDSAGPALFVQHRAGLAGRRFRMLKFRTMRCGADDEKECLAHLNHTGDPRLFKIPDDPRVTRLGRFLRRWSLDELPQFWNVLVGDMSLVGPRPFFERDLAAYEDHHFHRLGAKPGITGLWQVSGRSSIVDFEEVVRLDREYIETWSPWLDLSILLRTAPAVLGRTGAY